jgi:hypothetical protein
LEEYASGSVYKHSTRLHQSASTQFFSKDTHLHTFAGPDLFQLEGLHILAGVQVAIHGRPTRIHDGKHRVLFQPRLVRRVGQYVMYGRFTLRHEFDTFFGLGGCKDLSGYSCVSEEGLLGEVPPVWSREYQDEAVGLGLLVLVEACPDCVSVWCCACEKVVGAVVEVSNEIPVDLREGCGRGEGRDLDLGRGGRVGGVGWWLVGDLHRVGVKVQLRR